MTHLRLLASAGFVVSLLVVGQSSGQTRAGVKPPKGKQARIQNAMTATPLIYIGRH